MTKFVDSHRVGVNSDSWKIGVACGEYLSIWSILLPEDRRDFLSAASPGFVDWEGENAGFIGIGPVYMEWTVVDRSRGKQKTSP
jgi:hypothetical protein